MNTTHGTNVTAILTLAPMLALMMAIPQPVRAEVPAPTIADCDFPAHARILTAALQTDTEARGVWLDSRQIYWPAATATGNFMLYRGGADLNAVNGAPVQGADASIALSVDHAPLPVALRARFSYLGDGLRLTLDETADKFIHHALTNQMLLVQQERNGNVIASARLQQAGLLDALYGDAANALQFGAALEAGADTKAGISETRFRLWAPTAKAVSVCLYDGPQAKAKALMSMQRDEASGSWQLTVPRQLNQHYYTYLIEVFVPGVGLVRNRVTDPYALSLNADSQRTAIVSLNDPALKPKDWDNTAAPQRVRHPTDLTIYELHVRDFSINEPSVSEPNRGKYRAFTETGSRGMQHLRQLAGAGITDLHLLPVFDFGTLRERDCRTPELPKAVPADSTEIQAIITAQAASDCFNWGYEPQHFAAPEGSYASNADDARVRVREFREMVQALHRSGLRVGMDVVYNHTSAAGQAANSVLDRIVPGYYQRLDATGKIATSTCCANTATEHRMMAKLMIDTAVIWARDYHIDSFRFDLMGHQPRAAMEALQAAVNKATGRHIHLLGEGWNFGEIANGSRFVQASQLSLNGSGIGTFSDRARDALRGGSAGDSGVRLVTEQGYLNGLFYAPNDQTLGRHQRTDLLRAADLVRVGLAGSLRSVMLRTANDSTVTLAQIDYAGQPAGYVSEPAEVVNYVENHDNQTLYDLNALRLPLDTNTAERARVQVLGAAFVALSQGIAYFHAGQEILRSKSMDRNSFDSGDWFNRIDWSLQDNYFGTGLPPKQDNETSWPVMQPRLANPALRPTPADIAWSRQAFLDLLRIRASTPLLRLPRASDIEQRLRFYNTGSKQQATVIVAHIDGNGYTGASNAGTDIAELLYFINVDSQAHTLNLPELAAKPWRLHPVHLAAGAADKRPREARIDADSFTIPARTAVVFVIPASTR